MLEAVWISFGVVFLAEMGDKSQLMALTFATRYRALPVLGAITLAAGSLFALSVAVGAVVAEHIPKTAINLAAGAAFFGFALWTWLGGRNDGETDEGHPPGGRSALLATFAAFFVSELGDKTMLSAITLATRYQALGTWVGCTAAMVCADAIAIVIGRALGRRLPRKKVRVVAAVLFALFGALLVYEGITG